MLGNFYFWKDVRDLSIFADDVSCPLDPHVLLPVHRFLAPNTVLFDHLVICIRYQVKLKTVLRAKFLMGLLVVNRYPEELYVLLIKFVVRITERACFLRSARCVVFRIKEQHDALAF